MVKKKEKKKEKLRTRMWNWIKEHKITSFATIIILLLVFSSAGFQGYLYLHYLLGNDVIVQLKGSNEDFHLVNGEKAEVDFTASVRTNPFCTANCNSEFRDVSSDKLLDKQEFILERGRPFETSHNVTGKETGTGQKLYSFIMKCNSKSTALCHTDEDPTQRNILLTVEYELSEEQRELKEESRKKILLLEGQINDISIYMKESDIIIEELERELLLESERERFEEVNNSLENLKENFLGLEESWSSQNYKLLQERLSDINKSFIVINNDVNNLKNNISGILKDYNNNVEVLRNIRTNTLSLRDSFIADREVADRIMALIKDFNDVLELLRQRASIESENSFVKELSEEFDNIIRVVDEKNYLLAVNKTLETDIDYELLCKLGYSCPDTPSMNERARQNYTLREACNEVKSLNNRLIDINQSLEHKNMSSQYKSELNGSLNYLRSTVRDDMLSELPENETNTETIREYLEQDYSNTNQEHLNETNNLTLQLVEQKPEGCTQITIHDELSRIDMEQVEVTNVTPTNISFGLSDPKPECCVSGECNSCCEDCSDKNYPVVFLHGHSVNEKVDVDYSLDSFNDIQSKLEEDGYINAGAISLYTPEKVSDGVWGRFNAPISVKASYYIDVFREQEDYVVVQTKSENIETYAVRVKDIIDTVLERTGKDKVKLVAHSMGGLVARRYIQIFGDDKVEVLVMIGTPNKGISGQVAELCPVIGENLECRDMQRDSLFIKKLNSRENPTIPVYTIIGRGCMIDGQPSDGIVKAESAALEWTNNTYINGTCKGIDPLHTEMLNVEKYPKVYEVVKEAIE